MDILGGSDSGIQEICDGAAKAVDGSFECFIAAFILAGAQIVMLAYWMK